jgi:chorismate-pyruvate lyase
MSGVTSSDDSSVKIETLLDEFYGAPIDHCQLCEFHHVAQVPEPYNLLLNHQHHMTVTVESHCGETVDVQVHRCQQTDHTYSREITLVSKQTCKIVQYGIVRLDIGALSAEVWQQIQSQEIPLGRVLIEHNVLRQVELCGLWEIHAGPALANLMHMRMGDQTYGRTALIHCDGVPAIELLEIVAPAG